MGVHGRMSPTQRTLKALRDSGAVCDIAEYWNSFSRQRRDLFHFVDIVKLDPKCGMVGIQTTSGSNVSARVKKILEIPAAKTWLECGLEIEVWGWRKIKKKAATGKTVERWEVRVVPIVLSDF